MLRRPGKWAGAQGVGLASRFLAVGQDIRAPACSLWCWSLTCQEPVRHVRAPRPGDLLCSALAVSVAASALPSSPSLLLLGLVTSIPLNRCDGGRGRSI